VKLSWTPSALFQQGPHIGILISATSFELEEGRKLGLTLPELHVRALIDTGASVTIVNPQIAATCKLRHTGSARIVAVGGEPGEYREHAAAISFPGTTLAKFDAIRVVACPIIRQPYFSCLIGRDILRKWFLSYDGQNGQVEIRS
jgi:predicted aspartyl protease